MRRRTVSGLVDACYGRERYLPAYPRGSIELGNSPCDVDGCRPRDTQRDGGRYEMNEDSYDPSGKPPETSSSGSVTT
jgi:hypothetical protein